MPSWHNRMHESAEQASGPGYLENIPAQWPEPAIPSRVNESFFPASFGHLKIADCLFRPLVAYFKFSLLAASRGNLGGNECGHFQPAATICRVNQILRLCIPRRRTRIAIPRRQPRARAGVDVCQIQVPDSLFTTRIGEPFSVG